MTTVEKIEKEIIRTKEKITELQKKIRNLEARKTEEQNLQIVKLVKAVNIDNKTLTELLKGWAKGKFVLPEENPINIIAENKVTAEQASITNENSQSDGKNFPKHEKHKEVKNAEKKHN